MCETARLGLSGMAGMWRRQEEWAFREAGSSAAALFLAIRAATSS